MFPTDPVDQKVAARLFASLDGEPATRAALIRQVIRDGSWVRIHRVLTDVVGRPTRDDGAAVLVLQLADAVAARNQFDDAAREVTHKLLTQPWSTAEAAEVVARWLIVRSEPGEASVLADALHSGLIMSEEVKLDSMEWLIRVGSAELRSETHAHLCLQMSLDLARAGRLDVAKEAYRFALINESSMRQPYWGRPHEQDPHPAAHLALIGRLAIEFPEHDWLRESLDKADEWLFAGLVNEVIDSGDEANKRGLLELALQGRIKPEQLKRVWTMIFNYGISPRPGLRFTDLRTMNECVEALLHRLDRPSSSATGAMDSWCRRAASDALSLGNADALSWLRGVALRSGVLCAAIAEELKAARAAFAEHEHGALLNELLGGTPGGNTVRAMLDLLIHGETVRIQGVSPPEIDPTVCRRLVKLLNHPTLDEGFRRHLGGVTTVKFDSTSTEGDSLRLEQGALTIAPDPVQALLALDLPESERIALVEAYVVHELTHVVQNLGPKTNVSRLRATGTAGEMTLMHLDLGADHFAACNVIRALYPGRLTWLKDLQGRSLRAFPAATGTSHASLYRKSMRLVSLRVDLIARTHELVSKDDAAAYAFADFPGGGGPFHLFRSAPVFTLLGTTEIDAGNAKCLTECARPGQPLDDVDAILDRLVRTVAGRTPD